MWVMASPVFFLQCCLNFCHQPLISHMEQWDHIFLNYITSHPVCCLPTWFGSLLSVLRDQPAWIPLYMCRKLYVIILIWLLFVSGCPHCLRTGRFRYLLEDFSFKRISFVVVAYVIPKIADFFSRHKGFTGKVKTKLIHWLGYSMCSSCRLYKWSVCVCVLVSESECVCVLLILFFIIIFIFVL
jgi:hypothetical protein